MIKGMKIIYVAGPFRAATPWGIEQNIRKAEGFALSVAKLGLVPLCPHSMYRFYQDSLPDEFWLAATLALLKPCDGILLIPGWENSSGSRGEKKYAEDNKIEVFYSLEQLADSLANRPFGA